MGVIGIGGLFFRAKDPEALAAWYREHLNIEACRLQSGSSTETYALKNHFELVIVWSGAGSLRIA